MLSAGNYRAFEIVGDSMLPTPSGSVIVGEKVEDLHEVKPQHTYIVVSRKEGIVYKRVMKEKEAAHQLTLVSDNPDYQPYHIESEDVLEMWKASLVISKANTQQRWDVNQLASMVSNLQEQINTMKRTMN
jgi:phage repressor protein C with HTH and peptisase S24 domain